jgi:hypothetical protein
MYVALCLTAKAAAKIQQIKHDRKAKRSNMSLVPAIARRGMAALAIVLGLASASYAASPAAKLSAGEPEVAQSALENDPAAKPSLENSPDAQAEAVDMADSEASSQTESSPAAEQPNLVRMYRQAPHAASARVVRTPSYCCPSLRSAHRRATQGRILLIGAPNRIVRPGSQA